ncbi:predicted protein [Histoplasma capsulatum H143]|uniref:Uncharacterized protein n=1 Tax=Ajellomyces capsulatus (strain H143) TaxID=544712 RepID=C6H5N9_AJECH|nr:predicted protein [Histoplasma capsulatum H143]
MIRQTELLLVFALTLLGAVHAITGPPTPFANSAGQGDCPLIGRPHFSQGIQNTTSRNVSIVTPVVANAARPEIPVNFGKVIPTGLPRLEPNNMKGQQIVRASELKEIKAGTPEPEPASGSPRIPRLSKIKDGGDEDTVLKKPPSRRQPGGKDQYPNPDRFPLKPEKQKPPQPVRRGPDNAAADTLYVKDSSPDPNRNSLLFDLGPVVVNAHSPPTPPEKGSDYEAPGSQSAAKERNTKGSSTQDQKSNAPSNSLSKLLPPVENGNEYTTSSGQLQSHGFLITSNPSQGPTVDPNQRDKRENGFYIVPDQVMAAKKGDRSRGGRSMG